MSEYGTTDPEEPGNVRLGESHARQLLESAYNTEARPTTAAAQATYHRLLAELHARTAPGEFPDAILSASGGLIFLSSIWLLIQSGSVSANPIAVVLAMGAFANLILAPVAGIIIVRNRNH